MTIIRVVNGEDGVGGTKTNLDVSAYDKWTYVNLKTGETEIHLDTSEWIYTDGSVSEPKVKETIGIEWHIAIHRYEIKSKRWHGFTIRRKQI